MQPHKPTLGTDQGVSRDAAEQLPGDWASHLIDFDGPSFLEYDRVRIPPPVAVSAGRALQRCAYRVKRICHTIEVVLATVSFHLPTLSEQAIRARLSRFYTE